MSRLYSVYCHTNKINGKKYVGITSMSPVKRWANGNGYRTQSRFFAAIKKYGWHNFQHEILYTDLPKEEAEEIEVLLIGEYDSANPNCGYNSDFGGISSITFSEEHCANLSKSCNGRVVSPETRKAIGSAITGKKNFWYGKKRPLSIYKTKAVVCVETGEVYISVSDATRKNKIATGSISECCNGKLKTAGGYHWKFVEDV